MNIAIVTYMIIMIRYTYAHTHTRIHLNNHKLLISVLHPFNHKDISILFVV